MFQSSYAAEDSTVPEISSPSESRTVTLSPADKASVSTSAKPDELRAYFAEILPNFDRERVYPSDIKKLISWYNILIGAGLTEFTPEESAIEEASVKETKKEEA